MPEEENLGISTAIIRNFSLNRFKETMRDVVNDEIEAQVPDLVEDALENPTGTYKRTTHSQNLILSDISRTTKEIHADTTYIRNRIDEIEKKNISPNALLGAIAGASAITLGKIAGLLLAPATLAGAGIFGGVLATILNKEEKKAFEETVSTGSTQQVKKELEEYTRLRERTLSRIRLKEAAGTDMGMNQEKRILKSYEKRIARLQQRLDEIRSGPIGDQRFEDSAPLRPPKPTPPRTPPNFSDTFDGIPQMPTPPSFGDTLSEELLSSPPNLLDAPAPKGFDTSTLAEDEMLIAVVNKPSEKDIHNQLVALSHRILGVDLNAGVGIEYEAVALTGPRYKNNPTAKDVFLIRHSEVISFKIIKKSDLAKFRQRFLDQKFSDSFTKGSFQPISYSAPESGLQSHLAASNRFSRFTSDVPGSILPTSLSTSSGLPQFRGPGIGSDGFFTSGGDRSGSSPGRGGGVDSSATSYVPPHAEEGAAMAGLGGVAPTGSIGNLSPREQGVIDLISKYEGSPHPDIIFGDVGGQPGTGRYSKALGLDKRPLSSMTIREVMALQDKLVKLTAGKIGKGKLGTSAIGKGQFIRSTLKLRLKDLGIPESQWDTVLYDENLQNQLTLANFRATVGDPNGDPSTWNMTGLSDQWESFRKYARGLPKKSELDAIRQASSTKPTSHRGTLHSENIDNLPEYTFAGPQSRINGTAPIEESPMMSPIADVDITNPDQVPISGSRRGSRSFAGRRGKKFHTGVDIPVKTKEPVMAIQDGIIRRAEKSSSGYGWVVDIEYPDGTVHRSAHLHSIPKGIKVGQSVPKGTTIGLGGSSGNASLSFPHVHYEVIKSDFYNKHGGRPPGRSASLAKLQEGRIDPRVYYQQRQENWQLTQQELRDNEIARQQHQQTTLMKSPDEQLRTTIEQATPVMDMAPTVDNAARIDGELATIKDMIATIQIQQASSDDSGVSPRSPQTQIATVDVPAEPSDAQKTVVNDAQGIDPYYNPYVYMNY